MEEFCMNLPSRSKEKHLKNVMRANLLIQAWFLPLSFGHKYISGVIVFLLLTPFQTTTWNLVHHNADRWRMNVLLNFHWKRFQT